MRVIVGLGNPGEKYLNTRHNLGFELVDRIRSRCSFDCDFRPDNKFICDLCIEPGKSLILAKPNTYMNASGKAVNALSSFYKLSHDKLYIAHDDLDIALGYYKIQIGRGPKDHKGITSVEKELGTADFWRIRIGVDNRADGRGKTPGEEYVLQRLRPDEMETLQKVYDSIIEELLQ